MIYGILDTGQQTLNAQNHQFSAQNIYVCLIQLFFFNQQITSSPIRLMREGANSRTISIREDFF